MQISNFSWFFFRNSYREIMMTGNFLMSNSRVKISGSLRRQSPIYTYQYAKFIISLVRNQQKRQILDLYKRNDKKGDWAHRNESKYIALRTFSLNSKFKGQRYASECENFGFWVPFFTDTKLILFGTEYSVHLVEASFVLFFSVLRFLHFEYPTCSFYTYINYLCFKEQNNTKEKTEFQSIRKYDEQKLRITLKIISVHGKTGTNQNL